MTERMGAWLVLLLIAVLVGLPINGTTIFWVGILSVWAITRGGGEEQ
jgi:hypothetical protein